MGGKCESRTAAAWAIGVLGSGWLLMRLWCYLDLPKDCEVPVEAMDVITNLVVLLAFGVAQVNRTSSLDSVLDPWQDK